MGENVCYSLFYLVELANRAIYGSVTFTAIVVFLSVQHFLFCTRVVRLRALAERRDFYLVL